MYLLHRDAHHTIQVDSSQSWKSTRHRKLTVTSRSSEELTATPIGRTVGLLNTCVQQSIIGATMWWFGVLGKALDWLADYLSDRCQVVRAGGSESENSALHFGVPQGSVLGPKAFLEYTLKTSHISWKACSITCSLMTCRAKSTEGQLMSQQSSQL